MLVSQSLEAQLLYFDGYVIKFQGDTLYGRIGYNTPAHKSAKISFIQSGSDERIKFRPFQIKSYGVSGEVYESKIYDIHPSLSYGLGVFMRRLTPADSRVKLFEYWNTDRKRGFTQTFLHRAGYPLLEVNYFKFKKQVSSFFDDNIELSADILKGKYKKKQLYEIVLYYNEWWKSKENK